MKKSLLALAVVAALPAVAQAQSNVTLSGNIKSGVAVTNAKNFEGQSLRDTAMIDGSSRIIISGTEDLGAGLKGIFQVDSRFNGSEASANNPANGNTFVGLTGNFGTVQLGNLDTHYCSGGDEHGSRATSLGAASCALLGVVGNTADANSRIAGNTRARNVVRYVSPTISGFSAQVNYSFNPFNPEGLAAVATNGTLNTSNPGKGQAYSLGLNYAAGPLKAGLSSWNHKAELGNVADYAADAFKGQTAYTLFANYNLGVAAVGLTYDNSGIKYQAGTTHSGATEKRKAWSIPVTAPVGPGTALFTYTRAGNVSNTEADDGATMFSIGYDYPLSKRTSLGVSYAKINNKEGAAYNLYTNTGLQNAPTVQAGTDVSQFYVGVRHAF